MRVIRRWRFRFAMWRSHRRMERLLRRYAVKRISDAEIRRVMAEVAAHRDDHPNFGEQLASKGGPIPADIERRIIEKGG